MKLPTGKPHILIICRLPDPHVDAVCSALVNRLVSYQIWDLNAQDSVNFAVGLGTDVNLCSDFASAVWWRYKETAVTYQGISTPADSFIRREWLAALRSLSVLTPTTLWINHPMNSVAASQKLSNLVLAAEAGFDVPHTLVSNNSRLCSDFAERHSAEGIIYKPLTYYYEAPDVALFTSEIDTASLQDSARIAVAPVLLQTKIAKAFELRVTVVGRRVFCTKIDSQRLPETTLDWRRNQFDTSLYSEWSPPPEFVTKLLLFHTRLGLIYGAYDFIVERETERMVFLEVNPGGQWMWLEIALKLDISGAIADILSMTDYGEGGQGELLLGASQTFPKQA